jgi:hypothetical protein
MASLYNTVAYGHCPGGVMDEILDGDAIARVKALVRRVCWFLQDADRKDVVQDVLLVLSRRLTAKNPPDLERWLIGAVRRRRARWFRDKGRRLWCLVLDLPTEVALEEDGGRTRDPAAPEDGLAAWEAMVDDLSAHLTEQEARDVHDMVAGETCAAVARREGVSKDLVARRWKKTKEKLRRMLR